MLIEVDDLKVGDEIIVGSHGNLRYLKIIRPPRLRKRPQARGGKYTNAWCSSKIETMEHKRPRHGGGFHTWKTRIRHCSPPEEHNTEKYENLNYKMMWLVKRGKQ